MKRFAVFAWDRYYPDGGMDNFNAAFDTLDEAEAYALELSDSERMYDNVRVIDMMGYLG